MAQAGDDSVTAATQQLPLKLHLGLRLLQALAAASIHNVSESKPRSNQPQQTQNILRTANAVIVATKTYSPDRPERLRCKKLGEATFTAQTAAAVAAGLAAGAPAQRQLQELQELLQQHGDVTAVKPGAAVAAAGSTAAAAVLPYNQQAETTAVADMECDSDSELPLPAQLLQAVVCCCDSRTAAVAAQQFLQVSPALQIYLAAVEMASGSHSGGDFVGIDGDIEEASQADSSFVGQFPLDGSAVAGADLVGAVCCVQCCCCSRQTSIWHLLFADIPVYE
jgi:hypothetical protein